MALLEIQDREDVVVVSFRQVKIIDFMKDRPCEPVYTGRFGKGRITMIKQFVVPFVANLLAIGMTGWGAIGAEAPTPGKTHKSTPGKVVMNYDMTAGWFQVQVHDMHADWWQVPESMKIQKDPDAETIKKMFEEIVDRHAEAHIDAVVHCVWTSFETWMPNCRSAQPRKDGYEVAPNRLLEAGHDMIQVILERSRKQKIQFLAGLRMNDRHGVAQKRKFYVEHPEWRLEGLPGGLDYKHEGVRSAVLAFVEEFLDTYDVDGIEFDYMRWCHVLKSSEAGKNAPLLTDFTSKARKLLDEAARKRGRDRLLLGVRVPQTMAECTNLGFDVGTWIKEGLVDYVCPSGFPYRGTVAQTSLRLQEDLSACGL